MKAKKYGLGRRGTAGPAWAADRGAVLLETAIAIPVLVTVAASLIWACSIVGASFQLADVARFAAREIARGATADEIEARVREQAPDAAMTVAQDGEMLAVTLRRRVAVPAGWLHGLGMDLEQSARVSVEQGTGSPW